MAPCLRINGHAASFLFIDTTSITQFLELHQRSNRRASWRKILLTNPPVKRFAAYPELTGDVVVNEDGVTLGQVAAHVAEIVGRHDSRGGMSESKTGARWLNRCCMKRTEGCWVDSMASLGNGRIEYPLSEENSDIGL